ncbi:hypothetical protein [Sphingomonas adhaesiva]|uniref:hypothetical protein n=1 Tax=Sphingomonas adhaesiva TaxID=28212 RepID=UPI002FF8FB87
MKRRSLALPLLALSTAVAAAGCSADTAGYPSLAPRPAETIGFEEPAAPPPAPVQADPVLDARVAAAVAKRTAAARAFDTGADRAEAQARAARGASVGSDRWLDAQAALAELDSLRAAHGDALGPLEDLAAERAVALQPAYPALERALAEARTAAATQTRRIDAIAAMLTPA